MAPAAALASSKSSAAVLKPRARGSCAMGLSGFALPGEVASSLTILMCLPAL